ncbi:MAG TPA: hypothetical protein DSN98_03815 [Thermoplasmata archaeon]|jgi:hypothetical protein|nr:MAG TPA: hypothetical protein DSN98_03815 [Thermoplasmata archaeon]
MYKKTLLTLSVALLFIGVAILPITAQMTQTEDIALQETNVIEKFMDNVERIASESQTFSEFSQKLQDLLLNSEFSKFTIVNELVAKMLQFLTTEKGILGSGINLLDLLGRFSTTLRPSYFVISYGAYHRLSPRKENSINRFKEGLSMWRYSDVSKLLKGRTLILERHPFGIHQKMIGPQVGFMKGFKGIYLDIESRLTGNAYVLFLGSAHRIRTFDLTPLKK